MLIAAMVLGLVVGIGEIFAGAAVVRSFYEEWVGIGLILVGVIAAVGGFCVLRRSEFAMALLFLSAIGNFVMGLTEVERFSLFLPTALLALAGAFALSKKWARLE